MKKNCLLLSLAMLCSAVSFGQAVREAETSLLYYMPYTTLVFDIEYEEVTEQKGPLYQYSERYLRTTDIVKEDRTYYRLTDIRIRPVTSTDTARTFVVPFNEKYPSCSFLSLNSKGILLGVNSSSKQNEKPRKPVSQTEQAQITTSSHPVPLLEEQLIANSTAKMAENTAKQIYRLRESRLNWLSGDVEHLPGDGLSMQLVLEELNTQEDALTRLFVGQRSVTQCRKSLHFVPAAAVEDDVLFRFSLFSGVVAKDDMSGNPYYLTLVKHQPSYAPAEKGDEKQQSVKSPICYNIPGKAHITLTDGERVWVDTTVDIAQWGIAVALPYSLFKNDTQVEFNPATGAIKAIRQ